MVELTVQTAVDYLRERGALGREERAEVRELSGGVSSMVLLVHRPAGGGDFVLKQALPRLKVQQEWLCGIERIWREVEVLEICGMLLAQDGPARVPQILFSDRDNYCYAMTAAPPAHQTWKALLLAGQADQFLAAACGRLLAALHAGSWQSESIAARLEDRQFFEDLRIDPYYRRLMQVHPDLASTLKSLIDETYATRLSLVHGDFSPKNLLVAPGELWLIDFEVGHFGDPAFDLGFFLTHLALKAFRAGPRSADYVELIAIFWNAYTLALATFVSPPELADLSRRAAAHWSACLLARIDGKSPVDYLIPKLQSQLRGVARDLLSRPAGNMEAMTARVDQCLRS